MGQYYEANKNLGIIIVSWLLALTIFLNFVSSLTTTTIGDFIGVWGRAINASIAIATFLLSCQTKKEHKYGKIIFLVIIGLWIFSCLNSFIQQATSLLRPVMLFDMLYNVFFAYVVATKRIILLPIKIVFYIIAYYFIDVTIILKISTFEIFRTSAGGMIGTVMLCLGILIQYIEYRDKARVPILPAFLTLFLSIFSFSRTSLICSVVYFISVIFFATRGINNKVFRYVPFMVILVGVFYWLVRNWDVIMSWEIYEKFENKGMDSDGRTGIWEAYLGNIDVVNFFFGIPIDNSHPLNGLVNPHNSLIRLHSQIGIFSLFVFYYIVSAIVKFFKTNPFISMLIFAMLLRGFFDIAFFFGDFDFILFALVFEKMLKRQSVSHTKISIL